MKFDFVVRSEVAPSKPNNVVLECDKDHLNEVLAKLDGAEPETQVAEPAPAESTEMKHTTED